MILFNIGDEDLTVGELTNRGDIDFYRFNTDYAYTELGASIQVIGGMSDGGKTWATTFDLDYSISADEGLFLDGS